MKNITLYAHQKKALQKSNLKKYFCFFMEQGTGKTLTVICEILSLNDRLKNIFIICPNHLKETWKHEFENNKIKSFIWEASNKIKYNKEKVLIFNYEAFSRKILKQELVNFLNNLDISESFVVLDESHKIKNVFSNTFKNIDRMFSKALYKRLLTGTPIVNNILDIYSQFIFLTPSLFKNLNRWQFEHRYCVKGGFKNKEIKGIKNKEEIQNIINSISYRSLKKDCTDIPEKTRKYIYVEICEKEENKIKKVFEEEVEKLIKKHGIEKNLNLSYGIILKQLSSGIIKDKVVFKNKIKKSLELIEYLFKDEQKEKIIVWFEFTSELENFKKELKKYDVFEISGKVKNKEENINSFKKSNNKSVLLVITKAGNTGYTINESDSNIFFSHGFSFVEKIQAEDRTHRIGQVKNVVYYNMVVKCSFLLDEYILQKIDNKQNFSKDMLDSHLTKLLKK